MKIVKIIFLLVAGCHQLYGASVQVNQTAYDFEITFIGRDTVQSETSAKLKLTLYEIHSEFDILTNSQRKQMPLDYGERQLWKVALPAPTAFLNIQYPRSVVAKQFFKYNYSYLVMPGDSLKCEIFIDSMHFSGRGAERMNLQVKLFRLMQKKVSVTQPFGTFLKDREAVFLKQMDLLEQEKATVSASELAFLKDQCYGLRNGMVMKEVLFRKKFASADKSSDMQQARDWLNAEEVKGVHDPTLLAPYLMDYLYQKEKFLEGSHLKSDDLVKDLILSIHTKYSGRVSDHLQLVMVSDFSRRGKGGMAEVLKQIKESGDRQYRQLFKQFFNALDEGVEAYPFALPDTSGKIYSLANFKGKVVVLDFWFTGCVPCMALAKQMHEVMKEFKESEVAFVTINADTRAEVWKKSVKAGTYTSQSNINLFMGGKKSPMLLHYNINAFPRLIIIGRDGRIADAAPIKPLDDASRQAFISQLKQLVAD